MEVNNEKRQQFSALRRKAKRRKLGESASEAGREELAEQSHAAACSGHADVREKSSGG